MSAPMAATRDDEDAGGRIRPDPDPTALTDKAIAKAVTLLTQYIDGKFDALTQRLGGADTLANEKFNSVQTQFRERDDRARRESELNKIALDAAFSASKEAVAAAFAAQKEDANRRDEGNSKAIDKSERATAETIKTNQELGSTRLDALAKSLDEVKLSVSRIESTKVGATENRSSTFSTIGIIGTVLGIAVAAIGLIAFIASASKVG